MYKETTMFQNLSKLLLRNKHIQYLNNIFLLNEIQQALDMASFKQEMEE